MNWNILPSKFGLVCRTNFLRCNLWCDMLIRWYKLTYPSWAYSSMLSCTAVKVVANVTDVFSLVASARLMDVYAAVKACGVSKSEGSYGNVGGLVVPGVFQMSSDVIGDRWIPYWWETWASRVYIPSSLSTPSHLIGVLSS